MTLPDKDSIFFKFQGNPDAMAEAQRIAAEVAKRHGATDMIFAKDQDESKALWSARKNAHWAMLALVDGGKAYSTGQFAI
jgi:D-lactate dehydrogenase (cytochrome)